MSGRRIVPSGRRIFCLEEELLCNEEGKNKEGNASGCLLQVFMLFLYLFHEFLPGKVYPAFYGSKVKPQLICNFLVFVTAVVHLERNSEFRFK